ncbi:hypothetical protein MTO96_040588, partial [Rhipicephalus appendiculatus]
VVDDVNDAAGAEEKPVDEASHNKAEKSEKSEKSRISEMSDRARPEKLNEKSVKPVLGPNKGPSPSETRLRTMAESTPVYAERFNNGM